MTVLYPEATPLNGTVKVAVLNTVANLAAPDLSDEIGAVSTLDISCFIRDWNPAFETGEGQAPKRLCTTLVLPVEGNTTLSAIPLAYVYDPQAATSTDDNKARLKLTQGSEFYIVVRKGLPYTTAFAASQYVETIKVRCGRQNYVRSSDDEYAEAEIQQKLFPIIEPVHGQIAA